MLTYNINLLSASFFSYSDWDTHEEIFISIWKISFFHHAVTLLWYDGHFLLAAINEKHIAGPLGSQLWVQHVICDLRLLHDNVIKWKHFPRYWSFVRGIHRRPVNSPHKGPVTRSFDVLFDLRLNKRLSKQSWGWWSETSPRSLWRQCNVCYMHYRVHDGVMAWTHFLWIPLTKGQ